jgi:hypothetical protein
MNRQRSRAFTQRPNWNAGEKVRRQRHAFPCGLRRDRHALWVDLCDATDTSAVELSTGDDKRFGIDRDRNYNGQDYRLEASHSVYCMTFLASDDWQYDRALLRELSSHSVGDYLMLEVFDRAMELLHGCLRDGSVFEQAWGLYSQYPPGKPEDPTIGYEEVDLQTLLRDGNFIYGTQSKYFSGSDSCPALKIQDLDDIYKSFAIGIGYDSEIIGIHWRYFADLCKDHPDVFTNDRLGCNRLSWELAALVLHEVIHNHGFLHPDFNDVQNSFSAIETRDSEFDARHEYYRTLPCIAEQAVYLVAQKDFEGANYDRAKTRRWPAPCACNVNTWPQSKGPTGGAAVIPDQDWQTSREPVPIRVKRSGY